MFAIIKTKLIVVNLIFFILILLLLSCNKYQYENNGNIQNYYVIEKIINTGINYKNDSHLPVSVLDTSIYLATNENTYNQIIIYKFSYKSSKIDTLVYTIPDIYLDSNSIQRDKLIVTNFNVSKKFTVILFENKSIAIYNKKQELINYFTFDLSFDYLKIVNDYIIFARIYKNGKEPVFNSLIVKYNIFKNEVETEIGPDFDYIELSYFFPNNWVDVSNKGELLLSNTLNYSISIFDSNLKLVQKIGRIPINWKNSTALKNKITVLRNTNPNSEIKDIIQQLNPIVRKEDGSRIRQVHFLNDTTFVVTYTAPDKKGKEKYVTFYDIWQKRNSIWELLLSDLIDNTPSLNKVFTLKDLKLNSQYTYIKYFNNYAAFASIFPKMSNIRFNTFKDFNDYYDNYLLDSNLTYQLFLYKIGL